MKGLHFQVHVAFRLDLICCIPLLLGGLAIESGVRIIWTQYERAPRSIWKARAARIAASETSVISGTELCCDQTRSIKTQ
jgi:hypothetical protein